MIHMIHVHAYTSICWNAENIHFSSRRDIKAKCCERLALKVCGATSLADLTDEDC